MKIEQIQSVWDMPIQRATSLPHLLNLRTGYMEKYSPGLTSVLDVVGASYHLLQEKWQYQALGLNLSYQLS